ncbi:hypothetical protein A2U01_0109178, partial [Trifolium medium]|nr:hypothetical protein [Trifolium medium]
EFEEKEDELLLTAPGVGGSAPSTGA